MKGDFSVPLWATLLGWSLALGFFGFYFFIVHSCLRAMIPSFGFDTGSLATAVFGTVVMSGFVIWLAWLAELPEMWFIHRRPRQLLAQGRCPNCGHQRTPNSDSPCSECGVSSETIPPPYSMSWTAARRFLVALAIGILAGISVAEMTIASDEARMIRQTRTINRKEWTFHRAWPATFDRVDWSCDRGFMPRGLLQVERTDLPR